MANYIINGDRITAIADVPRLCNAFYSSYTVDRLPNAIATMNPLNMLYGGNLGHQEGYTATAGNYGTVELISNFTVPGSTNKVNSALHYTFTSSPAEDDSITVFSNNQPQAITYNKRVTHWTDAIVLYNNSDSALTWKWNRGYNYQSVYQSYKYTLPAHTYQSYVNNVAWSRLSRGSINALQQVEVIGPYTGDFYILAIATYGMDLVYQSDISQWEG